MAFRQPSFEEANNEDFADYLFGSKKKKAARAAAVNEASKNLVASGQPLSKASQLSVVLAADGKISKRDAKLIRKAGKKEAGTERRAANAESRADRTASRQESKAERQQARQDRKAAVGVAQAESAAIQAQGVSANANGIQSDPPVKQGQVAALDTMPTGSGMDLTGGGGGGAPMAESDPLQEWSDRETIGQPLDEETQSDPATKTNDVKDVKKQIFVGVIVIVIGYFLFKYVFKK